MVLTRHFYRNYNYSEMPNNEKTPKMLNTAIKLLVI